MTQRKVARHVKNLLAYLAFIRRLLKQIKDPFISKIECFSYHYIYINFTMIKTFLLYLTTSYYLGEDNTQV